VAMRKERKKILLIEDDHETAELIAEELVDRGFDVDIAHSGSEGYSAILKSAPDLVLSDISMPVISGFDVLERLTGAAPRFRNMPFVFLTALTDRDVELKARQLGADDFVTKPFSMRELVLRVRAVLRRGENGESDVLQEKVGPIRIDTAAHRAFAGEAEMQLTALEFKLLSTFMSRVGRLQTRETLLRDVWGMSGELQTRTVDTHVKRLREKLGEGRDLLQTVRGSGYRLVDPEEK